jgi:hypothetical protein
MIVVKDKYRYNWKLEEWEFIGKITIRKGLPPAYMKTMLYLSPMNEAIKKQGEPIDDLELYRFGDESTEGKL